MFVKQEFVEREVVTPNTFTHMHQKQLTVSTLIDHCLPMVHRARYIRILSGSVPCKLHVCLTRICILETLIPLIFYGLLCKDLGFGYTLKKKWGERERERKGERGCHSHYIVHICIKKHPTFSTLIAKVS